MHLTFNGRPWPYTRPVVEATLRSPPHRQIRLDENAPGARGSVPPTDSHLYMEVSDEIFSTPNNLLVAIIDRHRIVPVGSSPTVHDRNRVAVQNYVDLSSTSFQTLLDSVGSTSSRPSAPSPAAASSSSSPASSSRPSAPSSSPVASSSSRRRGRTDDGPDDGPSPTARRARPRLDQGDRHGAPAALDVNQDDDDTTWQSRRTSGGPCIFLSGQQTPTCTQCEPTWTRCTQAAVKERGCVLSTRPTRPSPTTGVASSAKAASYPTWHPGRGGLISCVRRPCCCVTAFRRCPSMPSPGSCSS